MNKPLRQIIVGMGIFFALGISFGAEFNSPSKLKVFIRGTSEIPDQVIGFTPVRRGHKIHVPEGKLWYVRPIGALSAIQLLDLARLLKNQNVPGLDLSDHWELSNESLEHLQSLTHLRMLDISQTRISDAGMPLVKLHSQLEILILPESFTDHAVPDVLSLPGLRELSLSRTRLHDEGLAAIAGMASLQSLDLSDTVISDAGLIPLQKLPHLSRLVLGGLITDEAGPHLQKLKNLEEIDISQTQIKEKGLGSLAALPKLRTIFLNKMLSDEGLNQLSKSRSIRALDLRSTGVTDAGIKHLSRLKTLEEVSLGQTAVGNESLSSLAELPELRMLDLTETHVTSAGLAPLARLKKLEVLSLSWQKLTRQDLGEIARLKQLKTIILNGIPLPDATMAQLKRYGAPSPWEAMSGLERARFNQSKETDASVLAAPVAISSASLHTFTVQPPAPVSSLSTVSNSKIKLKASKPVTRLASRETKTTLSRPTPSPIDSTPTMPSSSSKDDDNLLRVIALQSNPQHAGAFGGLSGMRQLRQTQTMASLNNVTSATPRPSIPSEEDAPGSSLGEISVGVHPRH